MRTTEVGVGGEHAPDVISQISSGPSITSTFHIWFQLFTHYLSIIYLTSLSFTPYLRSNARKHSRSPLQVGLSNSANKEKYLGNSENLLTIYLKFKFNWAPCILYSAALSPTLFLPWITWGRSVTCTLRLQTELKQRWMMWVNGKYRDKWGKQSRHRCICGQTGLSAGFLVWPRLFASSCTEHVPAQHNVIIMSTDFKVTWP